MNAANPLASAAQLLWTQSKPMSRLYQLKSGDTLVGNLRFEKASGSRASAEVASQRWTFKREGFFHPRVTVRVPDSDVNVAVFHPQWSSGGRVPQVPVFGTWVLGWPLLSVRFAMLAEACGSRIHHSTREGPNRRL